MKLNTNRNAFFIISYIYILTNFIKIVTNIQNYTIKSYFRFILIRVIVEIPSETRINTNPSGGGIFLLNHAIDSKLCHKYLYMRQFVKLVNINIKLLLQRF